MARIDAPRGRMSGKRASELAKDYREVAALEKKMGDRKSATRTLNEARKLLQYARAYK